VRLRASHNPEEESESIGSAAAVAHGKMRKLQGYTPAMLVHDSRILQVTLFGMLQRKLSCLFIVKGRFCSHCVHNQAALRPTAWRRRSRALVTFW
jgi:hypothetical protein